MIQYCVMGNDNNPLTHTPSWRLPDTFNKYPVTLTTVNDKEESIQLTYILHQQ